MKESDIRPQALFNRYLELSELDVAHFFGDRAAFLDVACPACASQRQAPAFEKLGMRYVSCEACQSLYLSPRPSPEMFAAYYRDAESVKFWGTDYFKVTAEARREKMFRPRAQLVAQLADRFGAPHTGALVDVGAGYGIFLEEAAKLARFGAVLGIEPAPNLAAICRAKGFSVIEKALEQVAHGEVQAVFATAFEVLEHLFEPAAFLAAVRRILAPGGICLFTTLTVTGFDIQVLWQHSKSVYPPHHLNILSVAGVPRLVERAGLQLVELSTPGQLDVDIVRNAVHENPTIPLPRFIRHLICDASDDVREDFQRFLQANRLSSHIRVVARLERPGVIGV